MFDYWYALPVVALGCTLTVMGGIGGNVLCGPFFVLVLQLPPHVAIGTALVTEVFSMSSGVLGYAWRRVIDYRLAGLLVAGAAPMAVAGSWLSVRVPGGLLRGLFGGAILAMALLLLRSTDPADGESGPSPREAGDGQTTRAGGRLLIDSLGRPYRYDVPRRSPLVAASMAAGLGSGLVGIGGGEFNTPVLAAHGVPIRVAAATAVAVMAATVSVGAATHILLGAPAWRLAVWTIPGAVLGGQAGSYLASHTPAHRLRRWLSGLFLLVGITMLVGASRP